MMGKLSTGLSANNFEFLLSSFILSLGIFAAAHDMKSEWVVVNGVSHFADSRPRES